MDIEKQIHKLISEDQLQLDSDKFLDKLHKTQSRKARNQQRITYIISSLIVVLLVGILSITQLNNTNSNLQYGQYFSDIEMSDEMMDEYYEELMVYLVDDSDDIWSTLEFFYEIENQTEN
jgi:hypothetical protein